MPRELLYPCFLTCVEYTDDEYWRNIFEDLAFGITPQGTYISKNYLISNAFVYKINTNISSETLFLDIYNLFSEKLGLRSLNEIEDLKNTIDSSELTFNSWNSIKKKSIRDSIIMNYINAQTELHQLPTHVSKKLLNTINLGLMLKFITTKDIEYGNGSILSIQGITFKDRDFVFDKQIESSGSNPVIEYNKHKITFVDCWLKLIDMLFKSIFKSTLNKT